MKLYGDKTTPCVQSVLLAAEFAGLQMALAPPAAQPAASCCTHKALKFETPQGVVNAGAPVILRHIARCRPDKALYGKSIFEETQVENTLEYLYHFAGAPAAEHLKYLNEDLKTKTFFVGNSITIADIAFFAAVNGHLTGKSWAEYPHLCRWFTTMSQRLPIKKVYPAGVSQLTAPAAAPAAAAATAAGGEDGDDEPVVKKTNPLDLLPPTALNNEEWKRVYSNAKDPKKEAMPWFWEKYDPAGWSLWYMKYDKLPEELEKAFGASNQLAGFLQRTDNSFRRYSFANCNIVGKDGDWDIIGVWLFRGTEIPFEMKDHPSFQYHTWRKLDHTNPADKALVEDYWCNDDEVEGRSIGGCKVYK